MKKILSITFIVFLLIWIASQYYRTDFLARNEFNKIIDMDVESIESIHVKREEPTDSRELEIVDNTEIAQILDLITNKIGSNKQSKTTYPISFSLDIILVSDQIYSFKFVNNPKEKNTYFYFYFKTACYSYTAYDSNNIIKMINEKYWSL